MIAQAFSKLPDFWQAESHFGTWHLALHWPVSSAGPIALIADRSNRRNLIALALAVWSGMTALSGLAANIVHLILARIGVGIGEAGCSPPAHSMIADYYPPERRSTAMGIYTLGISFGTGHYNITNVILRM